MKKIAVIAMAFLLIASSSLFAQLKASGSIRYDAGVSITNEKDEDGDTKQAQFKQNVWNTGTTLGVSYTGDNVSAGVSLAGANRADGNSVRPLIQFDNAFVTWNPGPVELTAKWGWTPIAYFSPLNFQGDGNYGAGAIALRKAGQFKVAVSGFYLGIYEGGKGDSGDGFDTLLPGFYAGYDFALTDVGSIGVAAQGFYDATDGVKEFGIAAALRGTLNFGAPTLRFNVGYVQNEKGALPDETDFGGKNYIEGYVGLNYAVTDNVAVEATVGTLFALDADGDGSKNPALRFGLDANWKTASGVSVIPGVIFNMKMKAQGDEGKDVNINVLPGVSVAYSF